MTKKILVVEDAKDIADLVKLVLETDAFEVETVQDSRQALPTAKEWEPDAILLDITMPELSGWDVLNLLRKEKQFDNVPIAMLTGRTDEFEEMISKVMNVDDFIKKPFGKQELIDKVHELFK